MALTAERKKELEDLIAGIAGPVVKDLVAAQFAKLPEKPPQGTEVVAAPPLVPVVEAPPAEVTVVQRTINNLRADGVSVPYFVEEANKRMSHRDPRGMDVARMIGCFLAAKGDVEKAQKIAERRYGTESRVTEGFTKALAATDADAGGFIVRDEMAAEIIELLRPASVVRQLGPRFAPLDSGTLRLPKMTGGASGGYIGENQNIPVDQQVFGQVVATARKLAVLTPISNDLIRRASASAETLVRDDLRDSLATRSDLAFIRGTGVGGEPKGLKNWTAPANVLASGTSTPASVSLGLVTEDIGRMLQALADANVSLRNPGWIIEPRTWRFLITIRDGNGNLVFRDEMSAGTLFGIPYGMTTQIPRNLDASSDGDNDETEIYLWDFADVIIAEATQLMIDVSDVAAYHDGTNVVAAFSQDQTVIRAILEHDLVVRHEESGVLLENVVYGV